MVVSGRQWKWALETAVGQLWAVDRGRVGFQNLGTMYHGRCLCPYRVLCLLQRVAARRSVLKRIVAGCCSVHGRGNRVRETVSCSLLRADSLSLFLSGPVLRCVAVCCSVLQCVIVCCSVMQCDTVCCSVF